ncbi:MAG: 2-hydroxyacyl-CoA dehydratase family protein [Lachnospiraceae bacterium]|nr:2-hydroxyacyl-CoA dehydratase family protein [Lachnospiraceae bacterium]
MGTKDEGNNERELLIHKRQQERYLNKSRQISAKYLNKLDELPGIPTNLSYFKSILYKIFVENEIVSYKENEIYVGIFCVLMPMELIYACGARPVKLCSGDYVGFQFGDDVVPRDACPLVKAVVGNNYIGNNNTYNACSMYIVPVTCDCKKKMAAIISEYKETYILHVPINKKNDETMDLYVKSLHEIVHTIEQKTGEKITYKKLKKSVQMYRETQREIRRFIELKRSLKPLIRGSHAMAVINSIAYDDIARYTKQLAILNKELETRRDNGDYLTNKKLPRILVTGSPITFPNLKIPLLIEEMGGLVVADETCIGDRGFTDPVSVAEESLEGYFRAIANRYVSACSCPVFSDNEQRIHKIKQMIIDQKVEGIIYHVLRGCLVYDYEYQILEQVFGAMEIPIIRLESDYNEEDIEQLRIRIEAFIEMIKFKK